MEPATEERKKWHCLDRPKDPHKVPPQPGGGGVGNPPTLKFCQTHPPPPWGRTDTKQNPEDNAGKPMNLFRPVANANEKQQFCQIVKGLVFNKYRKRWHMRKKSQKTLKKNPKNARNRGENGGEQRKQKNSVFFSFDHVKGHLLQDAGYTPASLFVQAGQVAP